MRELKARNFPSKLFPPSLSLTIIMRAISGFRRAVTFSFFLGVTQIRLVASHLDVSGKPIGLIFKSQADCFTLEVGTYKLSRNVGDYQSTLRDIP